MAEQKAFTELGGYKNYPGYANFMAVPEGMQIIVRSREGDSGSQLVIPWDIWEKMQPLPTRENADG